MVISKIAQKALRPTDIVINGEKPHDIQIRNPLVYPRLALGGTLAFGNAYVDGSWGVNDDHCLSDMISKLLMSKGPGKMAPLERYHFWRDSLSGNRQSIERSTEVTRRHYDLQVDLLYGPMLGKWLVYSCAYWPKARTLDEAQQHKMELGPRKLGMMPGMKVLDIGCGWGVHAKFMADTYGVKVTAITLSNVQYEYAIHYCAESNVEVLLLDYRQLLDLFGESYFDRIISTGMFEHVGRVNYEIFFQTLVSLLTEDGLAMIHTITTTRGGPGYELWIDRNIFPGGELSQDNDIQEVATQYLDVLDTHEFGTDYDKTLMAWYRNWREHLETLPKEKRDARFERMWTYYLHECAASFRTGVCELHQYVFAHPGHHEDYKPVR